MRSFPADYPNGTSSDEDGSRYLWSQNPEAGDWVVRIRDLGDDPDDPASWTVDPGGIIPAGEGIFMLRFDVDTWARFRDHGMTH
ncbi:MAG: hypothetical protein ACR2OH_00835 [Microthrixaceae bacterium]